MDQKSVVGKWVQETYGNFYMFFEDGKFYTNHFDGGPVEGRYTFVGDKLELFSLAIDFRKLTYKINENYFEVIGRKVSRFYKQ